MNPRYVNGKIPCKGLQPMSDAEDYRIRKAAKSDPDCRPFTQIQLKTMRIKRRSPFACKKRSILGKLRFKMFLKTLPK